VNNRKTHSYWNWPVRLEKACFKHNNVYVNISHQRAKLQKSKDKDDDRSQRKEIKIVVKQKRHVLVRSETLYNSSRPEIHLWKGLTCGDLFAALKLQHAAQDGGYSYGI
jgi:hypothetical protein